MPLPGDGSKPTWAGVFFISFCLIVLCGYTQNMHPLPHRAGSAGRFPAAFLSRGAGCNGLCCGRSIPMQRHLCSFCLCSFCWRQCGHTPSRLRTFPACAYRPWRGRRPVRSRSSIPDGAYCVPYGAARRRCSLLSGAERCWGCRFPASTWHRPRIPPGTACLNRG